MYMVLLVNTQLFLVLFRLLVLSWILETMSAKKCCINSCDNSREDGFILHSFPNPKKDLKRFYIWKNAIGGHIKDLDNDTIFDLRRVCHVHFATRTHTRSGRLSSNAVPSLHLSKYKNRNQNDPRPDDAAPSNSTDAPAEIAPVKCLQLSASTSSALSILSSMWDHTYTKDKEHDPSNVRVGDNGMSATKDNNISVADKDGWTINHEEPAADDVPNDTREDATEDADEYADEVAPKDASNDTDLPDPESRAVINYKAAFSWETEELIIPADDADVPESHQEASAPTVRDLDLDEVSLYRDDDLSVFEDYSGNEHSYVCDECGGSIAGFRYTCVQCVDWDLCGACEARAAHAAHYLLRIPSERPYKEIQAVLDTIRHHLLSENHFVPGRAESVKSEPEPAPECDPLGDWDAAGRRSSHVDVPDASGGDAASRAPHARLGARPLTVTSPKEKHPETRQIPLDASNIPTFDITTHDLTQDCSSSRLRRITKPIGMRVIKKRKIGRIPIVDENASEVSQEKRISFRRGDKLTPHRTDPSPESTTRLTAPTAIPNMESAKSETKAVSNVLVRVPAGFDPVEVAKMLNTKVLVRLKPLEEMIERVV